MRFNSKKYKEIMEKQGLTKEIICIRTGLFPKSFQWIMTNGYASEDAMERLVEAAGLTLSDMVLPDFNGTAENCIEFLKDQKRATVTFSQVRYITRIKKLAEKYPEECEIVAINKIPGEGEVICAHVPTAWIRVQPAVSKELTEEQRKEIGEKLLASRQNSRE